MKIYKEGSQRPNIELLQVGLERGGYYQNKIDGICGPATTAAVKEFQDKNCLTPDGIPGPKTWQVLTPYLTGYFIHQIKTDDTLSKIASDYNSTVLDIKTANPHILETALVPGEAITVPLSNISVVFTNINFTYLALSLCIDGLCKRYPFLKIKNIAHTIDGRNVYSIAIGEGENHVCYNASHHANEWITSPILMKFVEDYARSYSHDEKIYDQYAKDIYTHSTIFILPMVNPDGVDLATGEIPPDSEQYKNALEKNGTAPNFPQNWKANLRGVDLNLNYPAGWERAKENKYTAGYDKPGPYNYVGPYPLSELETQGTSSFTIHNNFRLTLSYHTQGEINYWKYLDYLPPQSHEIGELFSKISGYTLEETPTISGYAGYKDWFIQTYNRPGYTIEVGLGTNPLPISQFDTIYSKNLGILVSAALV